MVRELESNIAGVSFDNDDGTSRQEILGKLYDDWWTEDLEDDLAIELEHEPSNEYDPNAIAVYFNAEGDEKASGKVGYLPADVVSELSGKERNSILYSEHSISLAWMGVMRGGRVSAKIKIKY